MINKIGIIVNPKKPEAGRSARRLQDVLVNYGVSVWMDHEGEAPDNLELLMILGGDGTVLQAFRQYCQLKIPFLCINFGTVGFLSAIEYTDLLKYLPVILARNYETVERPVMSILLRRNRQEKSLHFALNDLVIRSNYLHVSRQALSIDGHTICVYEGDGLIIATSTGSTGYALSAGGSIVEPTLGLFTITPLVAHRRRLPPLIVEMNHKLKIVCKDSESGSKPYVDGQELAPLNKGDVISISPTDFYAQFVVIDPNRYFELIRQRYL